MSDDLSLPNSGYRSKRPGRYGSGQREYRQGMEPATKRLTMFAAGLGGVLVALIGASAIVGHRVSEVPVVSADTRPLREKPADPGGLKVEGADNDLFSGKMDTDSAKLAPPAETPDLRPMEPPPSSQAAAPRQQPSAPPAAAAFAEPTPAEEPTVTTLAPPPVATAPPPAVAAPAAPPANRQAVAPSVTVAPSATKPAPVKPRVAAVETHPSSHLAVVQLAAVTSDEGARQEWEQLIKRMPDLLKGRQPNFSRTERDGHIFWRIRTTGFADTVQARDFCDHVHAKGGGCSVTDF